VNNLEMAKPYERQARERLRHAREALESGNYPYVVRQCQEAVELLLKAALRAVGGRAPEVARCKSCVKGERGEIPRVVPRGDSGPCALL
jgi:HEPN domain-containing protein